MSYGGKDVENRMPLYALDDWCPELPSEGEYWIAPNATLIGRVRLARGASVWFGSVLRGDNDWISIGENTNIQDLCVLHTDPGISLTLGKNVSVGHGAVVHGAIVGDNSIVGMGATLLNRAKIGRNSIVGAHALIPEGKEFPDNSLIVGVPGKAVRSIPEQDVPMLLLNAQIYCDRWQRYRTELKKL
jgi:carbonic anhydrase/acetyltransferase-like protein (isoleucine patch superfamily)